MRALTVDELQLVGGSGDWWANMIVDVGVAAQQEGQYLAKEFGAPGEAVGLLLYGLGSGLQAAGQAAGGEASGGAGGGGAGGEGSGGGSGGGGTGGSGCTPGHATYSGSGANTTVTWHPGTCGAA
jgi:hypothetical protein